MQSLFPLYEELANISSEPALDNAKASSLILLLEREHSKMIYLLIFVHAHLSKKPEDVKSFVHVPYGGRFETSSNSLSFVLDRLPKDLQRIIRHYVERATSSQ
jgi:hypothetical protein